MYYLMTLLTYFVFDRDNELPLREGYFPDLRGCPPLWFYVLVFTGGWNLRALRGVGAEK